MMADGVVYFGGGYVGLIGSLHFAKAGIPVTLFDIDPKVVAGIDSGKPRGKEFLSYLHTELPSLLAEGLLKATCNLTDLAGQSTFLIAVPSERKGEAWMEPVIETVNTIIRLSNTPPTILIESTLMPGTTRKIVKKLIDQFNILPGIDYFLAVCPRRDWFADQNLNVTTLPRVVGGVTPQCTEKAINILSKISQEILSTDAETAEFTKSIENGLFHTHIAYGHQLALAFPDKNIAEALDLACTHWRLPKLYLGFGTGGRCIPLANRYLLTSLNKGNPTKLKQDSFSLAVEAIDIDEILRTRITEAIRIYCQRNPLTRVMILGLGYRPDFADVGLSPGLEIARRLTASGFPIVVHDTLYSPEEIKKNWGLTYLPLSELSSCELILLATPHTPYLSLPQSATLWRRNQCILDANGAWKEYRKLFTEKGVIYTRVGDPNWLSIN